MLMKSGKISVIIPVYNQLEYFKKCITSVVNQTYSNLEIICVDDGSTDGVELFLDAVAMKDERIIVIHQENKGESNARNVALEKATGEYIAFVDCDDWIEIDMYEELITKAEEENLDIVAGSWFKEVDGKSIEIKNEKTVPNSIIDRDELLRYIYMRDSYRGFAYMWNKLFRKTVLKEKFGEKIKFDENLKLGADVLYLAQAAVNSKRAVYIDKAYYHYLIRGDSGSHARDLTRRRDWITAYERTIVLLNQKSVPELTIDYVKRFLAYHAMEAVEIAIAEDNKMEQNYFQNLMKEYAGIYIKLNGEHPERIKQYKYLMEI